MKYAPYEIVSMTISSLELVVGCNALTKSLREDARGVVRFLTSRTAATRDTSPIPGEPEPKRLPHHRNNRDC